MKKKTYRYLYAYDALSPSLFYKSMNYYKLNLQL